MTAVERRLAGRFYPLGWLRRDLHRHRREYHGVKEAEPVSTPDSWLEEAERLRRTERERYAGHVPPGGNGPAVRPVRFEDRLPGGLAPGDLAAAFGPGEDYEGREAHDRAEHADE